MPGAEEDVDERISRTLFCKGLTQEVTQSIVYELFLIAGPIQCVHLPRARVCENPPLGKTKAGGTTPLGNVKEGGTVPLGVAKAKEQASNNYEQNGNIMLSTSEREDNVGVVFNNTDDITPMDKDPSAINRGVLFESCDDKEIEEQDTLESLIEASGICMDIMGCTKKVTNVTSVSDDKPFSVEDKILPRYKAGDHQGYAFIIFRHVQSVPYAMNIFLGTKLFGSRLSMSPGLQAIQKMRQGQPSDNCRNAEKRKTETSYRCPKQDRMPSSLYASDIGNNRSLSNHYINVMRKGPNGFNDQRHLSYTDDGMGQYGPPGNTNKRPIHGYGNMLNNSYSVEHSNMSQANWRMRPEKSDCNVFEGSSTISRNHIVNNDIWHWRSKPSGSVADNILPNPRGTNLHIQTASIPQAGEIPNYSSPCEQPQKISAFDLNSKLLARVSQLDFKKRERSETRGKPIIDSDSFLSLTLNPTPNDGSKASLHSSQIDSTTSPAHKNSPPIKPLLRPLEIDSLNITRPLNVSGDKEIPILHYEIDKKPDNKNFSNITYPDESQRVSEIRDLQQPTIPSLLWAPMYQPYNISTDAQRIVDPMPDRKSKPGQYQDYSAYEHQAKLSDLRSYQSVQCLDADNPYAQSQQQQQQQRYHGSEFQPPYHYPVHQDNNYFTHSNQPRPLFLGQFSRLSLDYNSNGRPSAIYTRTFGPSSPRSVDELDVHRTSSAPSTLIPATTDSRARPSRSDGCVDEPLSGQWVSPVAWKTKRQNATRVRNDTKVDRTSRNFNPQKVEQASTSPRHGASKKSERRHTMSECIDTAFAAYQQRGGASTTPRARPAAGGASPRRRV